MQSAGFLPRDSWTCTWSCRDGDPTREGEPLSGKCDIHENLKKAFAWRAR